MNVKQVKEHSEQKVQSLKKELETGYKIDADGFSNACKGCLANLQSDLHLWQMIFDIADNCTSLNIRKSYAHHCLQTIQLKIEELKDVKKECAPELSKAALRRDTEILEFSLNIFKQFLNAPIK